MKFSLETMISKLPLPATEKWPQGIWDVEAFSHGTMSVILFTPRGKDYQTFHDQDELYFVVKGLGTLVVEDQPIPFGTGDGLFVKARERHHFENFSDDLILWAVFWGPKGGEKNVKP